MGNLSNLYISQSFQSLAHLGTNNALVPGTMTQLEDGIGQSLNISFDGTNISSSGNIYAANLTGSGASINTGSFVSTSSFNSYTSSTNARLSSIETTTASLNNSVSALNTNSASVNTSITNINQFTASQSTASIVTSINNLNTFSASALVSISNLNTTTASLNTSVSNLNTTTASLFTSTSLSLTTASFNNETRNLTFTKGNNQTFSVNIPDVSGSTNYVTTSSFEAYTASVNSDLNSIHSTTASLNSATASQQISINSLNTNSASVNTSITNINQFTQSANIRLNNLETTSASVNVSISNLNSTTASQATSISNLNTSASVALTTASLSGQTLTFTKGDNSTFGIILPDVSGSTIDTGSFVTTSSFNAYTQSNDNKVNSLINATSSYAISSSVASALNSLSASLTVTDEFLQSQIDALDPSGSAASITLLNEFTASQLTINSGYNTFTQSAGVSISALNSATASYVTETESGSFLLTASFDNGTRNLTFTKGNNTTFAVNIPDVSGSAGNFVTTSSFNSYTASTDSRLTNIETTTASLLIETQNLELFSASALTSLSNINQFTQSAGISINALNSATSSYITESETSSFARTNVDNNFTANQTFTNITATSASITYLTTLYETSSVIYSSGSNQFGDELTDIQTLSGSVKVQGSLTVNGTPVLTSSVDISGLTTTASFNAYTQSNDQRVSSLETNSASVNISINNINTTTASLNTSVTNLNASSASQQISIDNLNTNSASVNTSVTNLNTATASLFTSASLALVTASAAGSTITFTKGDNTQFNVTLDTGSATSATTIFEVVYTGENITKGDPLYISGSQGANPKVFKADASNPAKMPVTFVSNETIGINNTTNAIVLGLIEGINLTGYVAGQTIYVAEGGGWSASLPSGSNSVTQLLGVVTKGGSGGKGLVLNPGPAQLPGLDTGYMWVGGTTNQPVEITTASFASSASFNSYTSSTNSRLTNIESTTASLLIETQNLELFSASALTSLSNLNTATASLFTSASLGLVTASFSGNTLTFTKGDASTFGVVIPDVSGSTINTGSFATTGSNSFNGNQIITGSITTTQDITVSGVRFGFGNPAGTSSIAIGNSATLANNTDDNNIAIGNEALEQNTTGERNIGIGTEALRNIRGNSSYNVGIGGFALSAATQSTNTFALGFAAMEFAETSNENIAIGVAALYRKKANSNGNTAIGSGALREHYDGDSNNGQNMAFGLDTMRYVTSGSGNTAIGSAALRDASRANENVFIGWIAGYNASGSVDQNVVIGGRAGQKLANSSNTIIGHNAASNLINGGANIFIGQGAGASIVTGSQNTLIGSSLSGVDNWSNVIAISDGAGAIKTKFQSNIWEFTGSVDIQNTLTASLQQGYVWVGNSAGRTVTVATSSFGGGSTIDTGSFATTGSNTFTGDQTLIDNAGNFFTISDASGSMMLVAKSFTSASAHMSASAAGIGNFIFKTNSNTADTIISGSSNLFVNAAAPTAGFKRYVGGSGNIALNASNVPQISGSMEFSPTMNNNYFGGNSTTLIMRGPVSSSTYTISGNSILGTVSIGSSATDHAKGLVSGVSMTGNQIAGTLTVTANKSNLSSSLTFSNNNLNGTLTLFTNSSSVAMAFNNINDSGLLINNNFFTGSAGVGSVTLNANNIGGASNTITIQGTLPVGTTNTIFLNANTILGGSNTLFVDPTNTTVSGTSAYHSAIRNIIGGSQLIVSASSLSSDNNSLGSAYFGRYNANDGIRNKTSNIVFAVGTGNTTTRKTGFLIDSGSNTFVEGTLNVSGATSLNGNLVITGSLTASLQDGFVYVGNASGITTTVATSSFISTINTGSFATTGSNSFNGNQTITGSVNISGSLTTAGNMFQVTGSFNTFGNVITQQGVFTSSLAGGLEIDGIGYVGSGSAGGFFIGTTTQDLKIQNWFSSSVSGKNIVIENYSQTGSGGIHGKVALRARGDGGAVTVENTSQFRVECQTEITGSLIVSGSLAAANNIKMGRGTDKPTNKVTVGSGGLIVSNSLVTADSYIFATNDTTVGNYSPVVSNITAGSFSLSNGGYGGNISVMYMIVNPY